MKIFEFARPADAKAAIATSTQAKTAQQGADVRFIAGGTTLIDLMKLNVETPARVLDINRLPLDKIESIPDGGLRQLRFGQSSVSAPRLSGPFASPPQRGFSPTA
jgi:xanthine dehydrogenase YagS FAD-binding subunit